MTDKINGKTLEEIEARAQEAIERKGTSPWYSPEELCHITTMDPPTTLALVSRLRELKAEVTTVREWVNANTNAGLYADPRGRTDLFEARRACAREIRERLNTPTPGEGE